MIYERALRLSTEFISDKHAHLVKPLFGSEFTGYSFSRYVNNIKAKKYKYLLIFGIVLVLLCLVSVGVVVVLRQRTQGNEK